MYDDLRSRLLLAARLPSTTAPDRWPPQMSRWGDMPQQPPAPIQPQRRPEPRQAVPPIASIPKPVLDKPVQLRQRRRRLQAESALLDPRVRAFLDVISFTEGSDYDTLFGGARFKDDRTHPGQIGASYRGTPQSAAGRYQVQQGTFKDIAGRLGALDFSPHAQDLMAVDLIMARGALPSIQSGDLARAVSIVAPIWASLPQMSNGRWGGSAHGQPYRRYDDIQRHYAQRIGYHSTVEQRRQRASDFLRNQRALIGR